MLFLPEVVIKFVGAGVVSVTVVVVLGSSII